MVKRLLAGSLLMLMVSVACVCGQEVKFRGKTLVMEGGTTVAEHPSSAGELAVVHDSAGKYALFVGISTDSKGFSADDFSVSKNVVVTPAAALMLDPPSGSGAVTYGNGAGMSDGKLKVTVGPVYTNGVPSHIMLAQTPLADKSSGWITIIPWDLELYTRFMGVMMKVLQH